MRALILAVAAAAAAAIATLWWLGAGQVLLAWAVDSQRAAQNAMAAPLRALRAGDPSAVWALYGAAFLYGLFHAAGPGHGKLLIGGYGAARQVGALRLSLVALAASLAQGLAAILLVGAGLAVLGLGRQAMTDLAERLLQPLGYAAIAAIGLWLASRGVRSLLRRSPQPMPVGAGAARPAVPHDHVHAHEHGPSCGHSHGPSPADVAAATSLRELLVLIVAVAIRPCTGALFILILTAQMGVFGIGVAAALAMALGTASVTVLVALASVGARRGLVTGLAAGAERMARIQPGLEIAMGLAIAWVAGGLALATL